MQIEMFPDEVPQPRHRLLRDMVFFGVLVPLVAGQTSALVRSLRQSHKLTGRERPAETLHVSLLRIGHGDRLRASDIATLRAAAATVQPPRFTVRFETALTFGGRGKAAPRPLVLEMTEGSDAVKTLAVDLAAAAARHGMRIDSGPPAIPHLTLLYDPVAVPRTPLAAAIEAPVTDFALIWSHRGHGRYSILWP